MSTQTSSLPKGKVWTRYDVPSIEWLEENSYICAKCKVFVKLNPSYPDIRGCLTCGQTFNSLGTEKAKCLIEKKM